MNPRHILLAACLLALALPASAQAPVRIAYIMPGGVAGSADRLAAFKQNKLGYYYNSSKVIHQRWPNIFFAQVGLFALYEARLAASRSR